MYTFFKDMIFLRVMGYLFTVLIILIIVMLIMLLIWKKFGHYKTAKRFCKNFLKERFWKKHMHGLVYLFFLPTMVIGLMKMRNYESASGNAFEGFSIFCSYVFMIAMLIAIIYFTYKAVKLFRDNPSTCLMIQKGYDYISSQEVIHDENGIYYFSIEGTSNATN